MSTEMSRPRPHVRVLTTGGTIASRWRGASVVATDGPDDLLAHLDLPGIGLEGQEVLRIGSYRVGDPELRQIARAAHEAAHEADGVVVTHGTDTMEESAFLTDLVHSGETPIVFCGAQRHADEPDTDGPRNLENAVRLAANEHARGIGTVVCMAGTAWPARFAAKTHTTALDAYSAPSAGPLATVDSTAVRVLARPARGDTFDPVVLGEPLPRVDIVTAYAGADGALLRAAVQAGARGIVVAGLGAGNLPPALAEEIAGAITAGVPVVVASRCGAGPVIPLYGGPGGGRDLARSGLIFAGTVRPAHARLLLALALSTASTASMMERVAEILARHM
ncbi:asparaginase [Actinobacteria bacterium YIM 96077]|uniref:asparaginase n=1 Tax=Phytoactinopolyspora halophila TaxID=1981511 RepID=A0A329QYQ8_9ACTN|nr:asparaginase [Phytoactinopolyspora halophila]AYY12754.1 asparaginase [Actinobacteria bacterium YIM 96077]RAW16452.1 asparaginase [Phytoactinopolyspora halophila]